MTWDEPEPWHTLTAEEADEEEKQAAERGRRLARALRENRAPSNWD